MNDHIHPAFQDALSAFCPPSDDGQQQATERPDGRFLTAVENLHVGGYTREAQLLEEARLAIEQLILCLESPHALRFSESTIKNALDVVYEITR